MPTAISVQHGNGLDVAGRARDRQAVDPVEPDQPGGCLGGTSLRVAKFRKLNQSSVQVFPASFGLVAQR